MARKINEIDLLSIAPSTFKADKKTAIHVFDITGQNKKKGKRTEPGRTPPQI